MIISLRKLIEVLVLSGELDDLSKKRLYYYYTTLDSCFRYCSTVWGQCGETLQNRAAESIVKIKYKDADHLQLLLKFGWLSVRNLISYEMEVLAPDSMLEIFEKHADVHQHPTRSALCHRCTCTCRCKCTLIPHRNLSKGQEAISYAGSRLWNKIPIDIRRAQSLETFKGESEGHIFGMQNTK